MCARGRCRPCPPHHQECANRCLPDRAFRTERHCGRCNHACLLGQHCQWVPWRGFRCVATCVATRRVCSAAAGSLPCCTPGARCVASSGAAGARSVCAVPPTNPSGPLAVVVPPPPDPDTILVSLRPTAVTNNGGTSAGLQYRVVLRQVGGDALAITKTQAAPQFSFRPGDMFELGGEVSFVPQLCGKVGTCARALGAGARGASRL